MGRIDFGYILRKLRHSRDETLEQVSEATGLSVAMLSRVERGERLPSPESVEALAKHFGLSADYLMSETIAHRLVNRYGEESSNRAAEHMSRDGADIELMAEPVDEAEEAAGPEALGPVASSRRPARSYGPFQQQDILAALGATAGPRRGSSAPRDSATPPAAAASAQADVVGSRMMLNLAEEHRAAGIDPTTAQVIRAATEASEAAATLVRRETLSLSSEARLELIDRVAALAGRATEVLHLLAADPDHRVRHKAREALRRLTRF